MFVNRGAAPLRELQSCSRNSPLVPFLDVDESCLLEFQQVIREIALCDPSERLQV